MLTDDSFSTRNGVTHRLLGIAAVAILAFSFPAASAAAAEAFKDRVAETMRRIEADPTDFPLMEKLGSGDEEQGEDRLNRKVKQMKEDVRSLLEAIKTKEDAKLVAAGFQDYLKKSERFRVYDYYVLWLANELLIELSPSTDALIDSLIKKVERRKEARMPDEIEIELSSFAIEVIQAKLGESHHVTRSESERQKGAAPFDEKRWAEFVATRAKAKPRPFAPQKSVTGTVTPTLGSSGLLRRGRLRCWWGRCGRPRL